MDDSPHNAKGKKYLVHVNKHPLYINVHVVKNRDANDSKHDYVEMTYRKTLTHQACQEDQDALFTLLCQCLPFEKWKYVDHSDSEFNSVLYCLKPGEGNEDEEEERQSFFDYVDRVSVNRKYSDPQERVRNNLRSVQTDLLEMDSKYSMFKPDGKSTWWFVLKALCA